MKLLIQPGDGVDRLVKGIRKAKKSIEILIFRFDRPEIERALADAVERGVFVQALIAFTNRGGEQGLRKLEKRFLAEGITVARTAGDLVRYHGKMIVVDKKELYLTAFNLTYLDIDRCRSFGLITRNPSLVAEAVKLFEADTKRQVYTAGSNRFLVSPVNARTQLARFIKNTKKELLVYDPQISDRAMLRLLLERQEAGVKLRFLGSVAEKRLQATELRRLRLHTRTIIRDRKDAFIGSQSLRQVELDARREIGVIFRDARAVKDLVHTFEEDWAASSSDELKVEDREREDTRQTPSRKVAKRIAKSVTRKISVTPVTKKIAKAIAKTAENGANGRKVQKAAQAIAKDVVENTALDAAKAVMKAVSDAN